MLSANQQMDFANGYQAAMEEIYERLNGPYGLTESYNDTLTYVKDALGK